MENHSGGVEDGRGEAHYGLRALLDPTMLEAIREANLGFLALVAQARTPSAAAPVYGLEPVVVAGVRSLDPFARRAAAGLPYTLFNMRFEDAAFWEAVVRDSARPGSGSLTDEATFARTVVFLAWHLIQGDDLAPAMALGMPPAAIETWRRLPLSAIDFAATRGLPVLEARWSRHPRFWAKLIAPATTGPRPRVVELRDLGLQLLAAQGLSGGPPAVADGV